MWEPAPVRDQATRPGQIHQTSPGNKHKYPAKNKLILYYLQNFFFSQIGCENLFQHLLCFYNYALHILTNQHNPLPPEIMFLRTKIDPPPQFDPLWYSRSEC